MGSQIEAATVVPFLIIIRAIRPRTKSTNWLQLLTDSKASDIHYLVQVILIKHMCVQWRELLPRGIGKGGCPYDASPSAIAHMSKGS